MYSCTRHYSEYAQARQIYSQFINYKYDNVLKFLVTLTNFRGRSGPPGVAGTPERNVARGCVELIGPCEFDPPATAPELLKHIDHPIVLVTTSSDRQADTQLPVVAMAALATEPVHVVAT
jgi:hypothetical protein